MATTTTMRLRVGTCGETETSNLEGKTLRNGLTSPGVMDTGKINGYTLPSNGHVYVSKRCNNARVLYDPIGYFDLKFTVSHGVQSRPVMSRHPFWFTHNQ